MNTKKTKHSSLARSCMKKSFTRSIEKAPEKCFFGNSLHIWIL